MPKRRGYQDMSHRRPDQCFVSWPGGVNCPNGYTHVLETKCAPGFMRVCGPHHEGYGAHYGFDGVHVWTRAEWEATGREQQLRVLIAAQDN